MLVAATSTLAMASLEAACYCGSTLIKVATEKPPISSSICHCATCRRLTGAPFLANIMLPAAALTVTSKDGEGDAALVSQKTSKHVTRHRCSTCYSPVYALLGKDKVVVPASLFSPPHPESWSAQHHLYYDRRVIDMADSLPKFRNHFGSEQWAGQPPEAGEDPVPPSK